VNRQPDWQPPRSWDKPPQFGAREPRLDLHHFTSPF
jgi:hypothetical protein